MRILVALSVCLVALTAACSGGGTLPTGPSPVSTTVEFHAVLAPAAAAATTLECAGQIHLKPSWWGFAQVNLVPVATDTWAILFEEVPIGRHTVRLDAPQGCVVVELGANGIRLTHRRTVDSQIVFEFLVHADGSVSP